MEDDYRATERVQRRHPKYLTYQLESSRAKLKLTGDQRFIIEPAQAEPAQPKADRQGFLQKLILTVSSSFEVTQ